jgi:hypothetical protein
MIGNNTGYQLQLASIAFQRENGPNNAYPIVPNVGYRSVRATLEKEQQVGLRAITINLIKAFGPVLTGFGALIKSSSSDYSTVVSIFNNPIEKGLEVAWPDTTIRHLQGLDDRTMRDNLNIANNTQQRTMIFLARDVIDKLIVAQDALAGRVASLDDCGTKDKSPCGTPGAAKTSLKNRADRKNWQKTQGPPTKGGIAKLLKVQEIDYSYVYQVLGKMVLIGDVVQHINRINISGNSPQTQPPPPIVTSFTPASFDLGKTMHLSLGGDNLQNAQMTGPSNFTFGPVTIDPFGKILQVDVTVSSTLTQGDATLYVGTSGGYYPIKVTTNLPAPTITSATPDKITKDALINVVVTGTNLVKDATVALTQTGSTPTVKSISVNVDNTQMTITFSANTVAAGTAILVIDTSKLGKGGGSVSKVITFAAPMP